MPANDADGLPLVHRPVGDVRRAEAVASAYALDLGIDVPPTLIRASMNATYQYGSVIVRVGRPSRAGAPALLAACLAELGIRVPRLIDDAPFVDEDSGLVAVAYEYVSANERSIDWRELGSMVRRLHGVDPLSLPAIVPLADPRRLPWWSTDALIAAVDESPLIDGPTRSALMAEIHRGANWGDLLDDDPVVCHGDLHPGNVIAGPHGPVLLDWDLISIAPLAWDHAPLVAQVTGPWHADPLIYDGFAAGYGRDLRCNGAAVTFARRRDLVATVMRVRAAGVDPGQVDEAERRLRYWVDGTVDRPWSPQ